MHTLGGRVCWVAYQQADSFFLGKVSGDGVLGLYSMAKQLATLPGEKVSGVVNLIASPVMAELQANREALRTAFLRSLRLITCMCLPLFVGLILVGDDLVTVLLGPKWMSAVPVMKVLCIYAFFSSIGVLLAPIMMARYRVRFIFQYNLLQLLVMSAVFWIGATWRGSLGVAIAWAVAYPVGLSMLAREAFREMQVSWWTVFAQFRSPAIAASLMAVSLVMLQWGWTRRGISLPVVRLALDVLLGATIYGTVVLWIGGPIRHEIKEVLGWIFQGGRVVSVAK